jgi:hypothetical protein
VENRWKALQKYELLRARKFAENAYYHELARELRGFGYTTGNRARGDFQIEGVSDELCERFSKRRADIDAALAKLLEEKPEIAGGDVMATRRLIATAERARKQRDLGRDELPDLWESQLTRDERHAISPRKVRRSKNRCPWPKRSNGQRNTCSTEIRSCWSARCGRRRSVAHEARASR